MKHLLYAREYGVDLPQDLILRRPYGGIVVADKPLGAIRFINQIIVLGEEVSGYILGRTMVRDDYSGSNTSLDSSLLDVQSGEKVLQHLKKVGEFGRKPILVLTRGEGVKEEPKNLVYTTQIPLQSESILEWYDKRFVRWRSNLLPGYLRMFKDLERGYNSLPFEKRGDIRPESQGSYRFAKTLELAINKTRDAEVAKAVYNILGLIASKPWSGEFAWEMRRFMRRAPKHIKEFAELLEEIVKIDERFIPDMDSFYWDWSWNLRAPENQALIQAELDRLKQYIRYHKEGNQINVKQQLMQDLVSILNHVRIRKKNTEMIFRGLF